MIIDTEKDLTAENIEELGILIMQNYTEYFKNILATLHRNDIEDLLSSIVDDYNIDNEFFEARGLIEEDECFLKENYGVDETWASYIEKLYFNQTNLSSEEEEVVELMARDLLV